MKINKELGRLKSIQIAVDAILIILAFSTSYFLRVGFYFSSDFPFDKFITIALATMPITLLFMFFARSYKLTQQIYSLRHVQRIAFVSIENVSIFIVLYYFTYQNFFSRLMLVYIFIFTFLFIYLWHLLFRWILAKSSEREIGIYRALIIGANRPAEELIQHLLITKSHIKPIAIIDAHGSKKDTISGIPIVGKMNNFEKAIAKYNIDHIIQMDNLEQTLNIVNYALNNNIKFVMPPELLGIFQGYQNVEEIEGKPFLKVHKNKKWWDKIW